MSVGRAISLPDTLIAGDREDDDLPVLKDRCQPGRTLIYICEDRVCASPLEDIDRALQGLRFRVE